MITALLIATNLITGFLLYRALKVLSAVPLNVVKGKANHKTLYDGHSIGFTAKVD